MKKTIRLFLLAEFFIGLSWLLSPAVFANLQTAFASAFFIIVASSLTHKRMVERGVEAGAYEEQRDLLNEIDDRFDLYDEEALHEEEKTLKEVIKEEKSKIKTFNRASMKYGAKGTFSFWRLGAYLLLVFGFIALSNNEILLLQYYLPALFVGIILGSLGAKEYLGTSL